MGVVELATHGVVMEAGQVRLTGTGAEVMANPEMRSLYLGGAAETTAASLLATLISQDQQPPGA